MDTTQYKMDRAAFKSWLLSGAEDNSVELSDAIKLVPIVLNECVTETQRTYIIHHFVDCMSVTEIAQMYDLHPSTVSRTIHRGIDRIYKYLRFSSPAFFNVRKPQGYLNRYKKQE